MKFCNLPDIVSRPQLLLLALCLALSMWYFVTRHETSETELEILVNYQGIPKDLFITSDLIYRIHERIRGPKLLIDKLPKTFDLPLDVSKIKVGDGYTNTFSVVDELGKIINKNQMRAFTIVNLDHPMITLQAEYIDSISIPLVFRYRSNTDLSIITHKIDPNSVVFVGPENEIKRLKQLTSWPIDVRVDLLDAGKGPILKDIPIIIPFNGCTHVKPQPSSIHVEYEIRGERVEIIRQYEIQLAVANPDLYDISPSMVNVRLKVPANKQQDTHYLKELRVTALPPNMKEGERRRVPLSFTPPEGMEIIDNNKTVTIIRLSDAKEHPAPVFSVPPQDTIKAKKKRQKRLEKQDKQ
ncbi:MAG: hypothetical protein IJS54_00180 [Desulfovibrio sp.]|nr:hypothetical protein [Desulfovibrio sp.]